MFKMLAAVGAYEYDPTPSFCAQNFLRLKVSNDGSALDGKRV
jgi:ATP-dependent RNA helicase DHX37/DHR1